MIDLGLRMAIAGVVGLSIGHARVAADEPAVNSVSLMGHN